MEKLAQERRMRQRGVERPSDTGFTVELESRARKGVASAEAFIQEAKRWKPVEEVAERNAASRATAEAHLRAILAACED
jgi:hypothetical protein